MRATLNVAVPLVLAAAVYVRLPVTGSIAGAALKARLPVVPVGVRRKESVWPASP
jgi:hypothetical protein